MLADLLGDEDLRRCQELAHLPAATLARLQQRFAQGRHARGQYFTPPLLADLVTALAIRAPGARVLEPAAGTGAFLRALLRRDCDAPRPLPISSVTAYEIDADLATIAGVMHPRAQVIADSFLAHPPALASFDAVIGNPPFSRMIEHAGVAGEPTDVAHPSQLLAANFGVSAPRSASAYVHFILGGLVALAPGGRLAMLAPAPILDVRAARGVRAPPPHLDAYVEAIVESRVERWFADAEVNVVIVVMRRSAHGETPPMHIELIALNAQLADFASIDDLATAALERDSPLRSRLAERASFSSAARQSIGEEQRLGSHLRVPADLDLEAITSRLDGSLVRVGELAEVRRGLTTGANEFFYVGATNDEYRACSSPLLKSPREIRGMFVDERRLASRALFLQEPLGLAAASAIAAAEAAGIHHRATLANRRPWWRLERQPQPAMVMAKGIWDRVIVARVESAIAFDQQLYGIYPRANFDAVRIDALWGVLASAWTMVALELAGRTGFGQGVLWLASYEIEALCIPDPRRFSLAAARQIAAHTRELSQIESSERLGRESRAAATRLECAILTAAGFTAADARTTADRLIDAAIELSARRRARAGRGHSPM